MVTELKNEPESLFDDIFNLSFERATDKTYDLLFKSLQEEGQFPGKRRCAAITGFCRTTVSGTTTGAGPLILQLDETDPTVVEKARLDFDREGKVVFDNYYQITGRCGGRLCNYQACCLRRGYAHKGIKINFNLGDSILGNLAYLLGKKTL